jgi:hypothetical protein
VRLRIPALFALALTLGLATPRSASTAPGSRGARIREFANRWLGTVYVWGGDQRSGTDCSGYLRQMYRDLFNVELPRTTRDQINLGIDLPINPNKIEATLEAGDLIFFIDREGIPSHVVIYMGSGQITHSESGRGVVVDPMKRLWGRRIVARRMLVPGSGGAGTFGAIPAAGPIVPKEIPCPPTVTARAMDIRAYTSRAVDLKELAGREPKLDLCDYRALAEALRAKNEKLATRNAVVIDDYALWLDSIDALQEGLLSPRR